MSAPGGADQARVAQGPAAAVELRIGGMTCASCASRVENKLNRMPGVSAGVNYATDNAWVSLPQGTSVADAIATVEATGYTARALKPPSPPPAATGGDATADAAANPDGQDSEDVEVFVVRPGEKIATDGQVIEGASAVDTALLTGEPVPFEVGPGDAVTGATLNAGGRLLVRATRVGADTALAQIGRLVARAQSGKAPVQRLADRVSAVFVPVVIALALATLGYWLIIGAEAEAAFTAAVAVLIIACPCALGLATPVLRAASWSSPTLSNPPAPARSPVPRRVHPAPTEHTPPRRGRWWRLRWDVGRGWGPSTPIRSPRPPLSATTRPRPRWPSWPGGCATAATPAQVNRCPPTSATR